MNDDQIQSELERRAGSAAPQPDWAKRVLLPAVWREVDAGPQPVVTSRWPSLAGVAALVLALLILVVAVPRLAPQPAGPSHSQSAFPTPTTPLSASGPTFACTGPDWDGGAIELTDHLGVIESCVATRGDRPEERTVVSEISRGVVGVTWQNSCMASGASLDLWPREEAEDRPRYVLMIDSRPLDVPRSCRAIGGVTVEVTFMNAELAPENLATDVEAYLMMSGAASDATEISGGGFNLTLSAGATQYSNDDPIDIQAQLLYEGDQPTIELSGTFSLVNGFGIEQLDGDLAMGPGWEEPCVQHQLHSGEPVTVPFKKSVAWSQDDPNADFYRDWSADPVLNLPAGTWLVTAYSDFMVGTGCSGERVQMKTAIVIEVEGSDAPPPSPPTPVAAFDCPPTWHRDPDTVPLNALHPTVVDRTGLVESCTKPDVLMADWSLEGPAKIGNPGGDLRALQVEWGGTPCGAATEFTLRRVGEGYLIEARSTYEGEYCVSSAVGHQIRINLSEPITAPDVTFVWDRPAAASPAYAPDELGVVFCDGNADVESFAEAHGLMAESEQSGIPEGHFAFQILDGTDPLAKVDEVLGDARVCNASVVWIGTVR